MSQDFDWIVEYESLPSDDPLPPKKEPPGRRSRPRRLMPLAGALATVALALVFLWRLGEQAGPLPDPNPPESRLEVLVETEINALVAGDREIHDQLQDNLSRRTDPEPPFEIWFDPQSLIGDLRLIESEQLDQQSARALVELVWQGEPYHLTWLYRRVNGNWRHTDWLPAAEQPIETIRTPRVVLTHQPSNGAQAAALAGRVEILIGQLCEQFACAPISRSVALSFDPFYADYDVAVDAPLTYRLAAPERIRWPADNSPEMLVLASIGRHLALDLIGRNALAGLPADRQDAPSLALIWLAHHMLAVESPPATRWLDEAVALEGFPTTRVYISQLLAGVPSDQALAIAFRPATIARLTALPDYFSWLIVTSGQLEELHPAAFPRTKGPPPWRHALADRLDWEALPWDPSGHPFQQVAPEIDTLTIFDNWAVATTRPANTWLPTYYFRLDETGWRPSLPDETLLQDPIRQRTSDYTLTYWPADAGNIELLIELVEQGIDATQSTFSLASEEPLSLVVVPLATTTDALYATKLPLEYGANVVRLPSPATWQANIDDEVNTLRSTALANVVIAVMRPSIATVDEDGWLLTGALYDWHMDQLANQLALQPPAPDAGATRPVWWQDWQPPKTPDNPEWQPLSTLWAPWEPGLSPTGYDRLMLRARLVIEYIMATYGSDHAPVALRALSEAHSLQDWLSSTTGVGLNQFEPAWREWIIMQAGTWKVEANTP